MLLVLCGAPSLFLPSRQSSGSASDQGSSCALGNHDMTNTIRFGGEKKDKTQTEQTEDVFWRNLAKQEVPWSTTMDVLEELLFIYFFNLWPLMVLQPKSHMAQKTFLSLTATHRKTQSACKTADCSLLTKLRVHNKSFYYVFKSLTLNISRKKKNLMAKIIKKKSQEKTLFPA